MAIIIGYQGIGKSTLGSTDGFIDLESSCMRVNDKRPDNWYEYYCNFAEYLSRHHKIVFTSSHKEVRDRLRESKEKVYLCYPIVSLKNEWIARLRKRYEQSGLDKDYRALMNAEDCFVENITALEQEHTFTHIPIFYIDYNLKDLISHYTKS